MLNARPTLLKEQKKYKNANKLKVQTHNKMNNFSPLS